AGTLADMNLLDSSRHNYIVALYRDKKRFGLACVDHTTGEFSVAQFEHMDLLLDELSRINPSELLVSDEQTDCFPGTHPTLYYDGYTFLPSTAIPNLLSHFRVHSLDGFGCGEMTAALGASGAVPLPGLPACRPTDHLRRISCAPRRAPC
ncbi:MAG: DNA mismatch repair protein MutS, partial [Akkermansia sp.]